VASRGAKFTPDEGEGAKFRGGEAFGKRGELRIENAELRIEN
jgi:hypothetical protein